MQSPMPRLLQSMYWQAIPVHGATNIEQVKNEQATRRAGFKIFHSIFDFLDAGVGARL